MKQPASDFSFLRWPLFWGLYLLMLAMVYVGYRNHFDGPFQFDDHHTIQSNSYIRDIKNIPRFFTDATTTSSLPANQAYRPGLTTLNTIDYWLSGEKGDPKPRQFHVSIFCCFLLLSVFIFLFALKIFNATMPAKANPYIALLTTAVFMLHTANAETINYIIARSDSFSTLMIMVALVTFAYMKSNLRYWLYLLPMMLGFFVKEPAVMIGPLAFLFELLFEEQKSMVAWWSNFNGTLKTFIKFLPAFVFAVALFAFAKYMTPKTWTSGGYEFVPYWLTQTFVMVHYVTNYFFPFNLSADTDWALIKNPFDDRVVIGVAFIVFTFWLAWKSSMKREFRPLTYGILWFYICLAPTSLFPFAEVLNDHRVFLPYIGLTIGVVWSLYMLYLKYENTLLRIATLAFIAAFLSAHTYGLTKRCEVWSSSENLWADVVKKSPRNGRGLMNYGNALMAKGDYNGALEYFNKAKQEWPYYSYIYTNLGVLYSAMGNPAEADKNFLQAKSLNNQNPEFYYFYARFLRDQNRYTEALENVNTGLSWSPQHPGLNAMKNDLLTNPRYAASEQDRIKGAENLAKETPTPENWLNLSLIYYNAQRYNDCIKAAEEALKIKPDYELAYNNICSAYNMLKQWDKAIEAGKKGLAIKPDYQLLKNNMKVAEDALKAGR